MNFPWPEWSACLAAAASILLARRHGRCWALAGLAVVLVMAISGGAGFFLAPAAAGCLLVAWGRFPKITLPAALCGIAAGATACWLFPEPKAPSLAGPHAVGTRTLEIPAGNGPRLLLQIWYPAAPGGGVPAPWLPDRLLAPAFPFHRIGRAKSRSIGDARLMVAKQPWPVIFYEHAWMGHRAENVAQVEDLASRGFVVIAVDHPGQASRVLYADGTTIGCRLAAPDLSTDPGVAGFEATAEQCLVEREKDLARVKQALLMNLIPEWRDRLALDRAGVFGFSFGGTTALRLCARDPWFHAGADEDGLFLGTEAPHGAFLFFDDELPEWLKHPAQVDETPEQRLIRVSDERTADSVRVAGSERLILDGTRHESFTDRIFLCPVPRLAKAGRRPAVELHHTVAACLAEFFGRELTPSAKSAR